MKKHETVHDMDTDDEQEPEMERKPITLEFTEEQRLFWRDLMRHKMRKELDAQLESKEAQYREEGYDDNVAIDRTINDMLPALRKSALRHFVEALIAIRHLGKDRVYEKLTKTAEELRRNGGLDPDTAIREAVRLSKHTLGALFVRYRDVDSEEESDSENDKETEN